MTARQALRSVQAPTADEADVMGALLRRRLVALRHDSGLSQRQLARRLGWSATRISNIEIAKSPLTVEDAVRYAQALDYDLLITVAASKDV